MPGTMPHAIHAACPPARRCLALRKALFLADVDDSDLHIPRLRAALDAETHAFAGANLFDLVGKVGEPVHLLAIDSCNHVADLSCREIDPADADTLGRRTWHRAHD